MIISKYKVVPTSGQLPLSFLFVLFFEIALTALYNIVDLFIYHSPSSILMQALLEHGLCYIASTVIGIE